MSDIPIPPEAVEALREELRMSRLCADPATARAALRVALAAWPGMKDAWSGGNGAWFERHSEDPYHPEGIILPLPQEARDDQ